MSLIVDLKMIETESLSRDAKTGSLQESIGKAIKGEHQSATFQKAFWVIFFYLNDPLSIDSSLNVPDILLLLSMQILYVTVPVVSFHCLPFTTTNLTLVKPKSNQRNDRSIPLLTITLVKPKPNQET